MASWLDPRALREAMSLAGKLGRGEHHYIKQEDQLSLWAFLQAGSIGGAPPSLSVNLDTLRRQVGTIVSFGIAEADEMRSMASVIKTTAQQIYRAWELREPELDRIRPYFSDAELRQKILPLEVVIAGRQRETNESASKSAMPKSKLTLPKRKRE